MTREGRSESGRFRLRVDLRVGKFELRHRSTLRIASSTHLVVDQAPLLQEGMHPHDRSYISRQVSSTRRHGQIFGRVQPIGVDHEIPIILVDLRRLASVLSAEEFGQGFTFEGVHGGEVEPCRVGRDNEWVGLGGEVGGREVMKGLRVIPERFLLGLVVLVVSISILRG